MVFSVKRCVLADEIFRELFGNEVSRRLCAIVDGRYGVVIVDRSLPRRIFSIRIKVG
jgi:hypothetical protein